MTPVSIDALRPDLEQLAVGGEGIVYRVRSQPSLVLKEYKAAQRPVLNTLALERIIEFRNSLSPTDRDRLDTRTIWPSTAVADGRGVCGFLMPAIGADFYRNYGLRANPKRVLCDWNQLAYQGQQLAPHMISEIPRPSLDEKVLLITDLVQTIRVLHRNGMVLGDLSGRNLIWGIAPARAVVIDCDSFRFAGESGVCPHKESPGWIDPALGGKPTTLESDIFKLGVAAYRALWSRPGGEVTPAAVKTATGSAVAAAIVELVAHSVDTTGRPTIEDWATQLEKLNRYRGRTVIDVSKPMVRPTPSPTTPSPSPHRGPRPRITLAPPVD